MKKIIAKLAEIIFAIQDKILEKKYKNLQQGETPSFKQHNTSFATLTLSAVLEKNKQKINLEIKKIAKENKNNLENLLEYAKKRGVNYYFVKNADNFLKIIKEEEGLIFPKKGLEALFLSLLTQKKPDFKTPPIFVFKKGELSPYKILYNFHKWYSFQSGITGNVGDEAIKNLNELEKNIEKLNYKEIISLKQIISRDREAMEFAVSFMKELEGGKNAFEVIKKEGGANV